MNCKNIKKICKDLECNICFEKSFASHLKSKYLVDNINPRFIFKSTGKKYNFKCNKCNHIFKISCDNINKNNWCSYCSNKKLCKDLECNICFEKSFASHPKSKYLVDNINPRTIFKGTVKKYNFKCNECNHIFIKTCGKIKSGQWCPYCINKKICDDLECIKCFNNSFASNYKSKYIINENPRLIFKCSNKKYNFKCDKCNHIFSINCNNINNNKWCSYCSNQKLCKDLNCKTCFKKSFASHPKSKYLVNNINPRTIFKGTVKKYNFECNECNHIFKMNAISITSNNQWCPICVNKTEKKVYKWLIKEYKNYIIIKEKKFKKLGRKRFDFYIKELNIIIEIDGRQHFKEIKSWNCNPKKQFQNDILKTDFCLKNNLSIIRINQEDIWNDKIDWKNILKNNLKLYEKPILLCFESMNKNNYEKIKNHFKN